MTCRPLWHLFFTHIEQQITFEGVERSVNFSLLTLDSNIEEGDHNVIIELFRWDDYNLYGSLTNHVDPDITSTQLSNESGDSSLGRMLPSSMLSEVYYDWVEGHYLQGDTEPNFNTEEILNPSDYKIILEGWDNTMQLNAASGLTADYDFHLWLFPTVPVQYFKYTWDIPIIEGKVNQYIEFPNHRLPGLNVPDGEPLIVNIDYPWLIEEDSIFNLDNTSNWRFLYFITPLQKPEYNPTRTTFPATVDWDVTADETIRETTDIYFPTPGFLEIDCSLGWYYGYPENLAYTINPDTDGCAPCMGINVKDVPAGMRFLSYIDVNNDNRVISRTWQAPNRGYLPADILGLGGAMRGTSLLGIGFGIATTIIESESRLLSLCLIELSHLQINVKSPNDNPGFPDVIYRDIYKDGMYCSLSQDRNVFRNSWLLLNIALGASYLRDRKLDCIHSIPINLNRVIDSIYDLLYFCLDKPSFYMYDGIVNTVLIDLINPGATIIAYLALSYSLSYQYSYKAHEVAIYLEKAILDLLVADKGLVRSSLSETMQKEYDLSILMAAYLVKDQTMRPDLMTIFTEEYVAEIASHLNDICSPDCIYRHLGNYFLTIIESLGLLGEPNTPSTTRAEELLPITQTLSVYDSGLLAINQDNIPSLIPTLSHVIKSKVIYGDAFAVLSDNALSLNAYHYEQEKNFLPVGERYPYNSINESPARSDSKLHSLLNAVSTPAVASILTYDLFHSVNGFRGLALDVVGAMTMLDRPYLQSDEMYQSFVLALNLYFANSSLSLEGIISKLYSFDHIVTKQPLLFNFPVTLYRRESSTDYEAIEIKSLSDIATYFQDEEFYYLPVRGYVEELLYPEGYVKFTWEPIYKVMSSRYPTKMTFFIKNLVSPATKLAIEYHTIDVNVSRMSNALLRSF